MIVKIILIAMCILGNIIGEIMAKPNDKSMLLHSSGSEELINREYIPGNRHNAENVDDEKSSVSKTILTDPLDVLSQPNDLKVANRNKRQFFSGSFGDIMNVMGAAPRLAPVASAMGVVHNNNENNKLVREQEAQRRANDLIAETNRKNVYDKRARMYARIGELNKQIEDLRKEITKLTELNKTAYGAQRLTNDESISNNNDEIELANAEIAIYRKLI